jgi:hypothetical protein
MLSSVPGGMHAIVSCKSNRIQCSQEALCVEASVRLRTGSTSTPTKPRDVMWRGLWEHILETTSWNLLEPIHELS